MRRTALPHSWRSTSMLLTKLRGLVSGLDRIRERRVPTPFPTNRSEEHTSELQSQSNLVCRLLLEKKKNNTDVCKPALKPERFHRPGLANDTIADACHSLDSLVELFSTDNCEVHTDAQQTPHESK